MSSPSRRPRRTTAEVRRLVLDAALADFAALGYAGASARGIAAHAGVRQSTMYRLFPSKDALYAAAVAQPFSAFLHEFKERWSSNPPADREPEQVLRPFVEDLFTLVREHRSLILAMTSSGAAVELVADAFGALEQVGVMVAGLRAVRVDVRTAVRISALMVVAVGIAEDVVFPGEAGFSTEHLIDEMVDMLVARALYNPDRSR